jgi:hypothetical protein
LDIQSYGVSKALAALVAAVLLARAFDGLGLKRDSAYSLVMWATIWGFVGAKIYYLLEHVPTLTMHDLGGMGFTCAGERGSRRCPDRPHPAPEPSATPGIPVATREGHGGGVEPVTC